MSTSESNSGVSILGSVSERLIASATADLIQAGNFFRTQSSEVQSYGDFVLMCLPNNLWLSVKSNFARERLLASGFTTDIVGVGFFTDYSEFTSRSKIRNFLKVGFLAMYVPDIPISEQQVTDQLNTYDQIVAFYEEQKMSLPQNINGKPFIRKVSSLRTDLKALLDIDEIHKRNVTDF